MRDGRAFHRPLHRPRAAAGADIQPAQAELVADQLGVVVLLARDRVAAPAHHEVWIDLRLEDARVAQDLEHALGQRGGCIQVETDLLQLGRHVDDVTHHRDQQLVDAADDLAVHERLCRCVRQLDLHAAILLQHLDVEIRILLQDRPRVITDVARGQHRQRTTAQQRMQTRATCAAQARHLVAGKNIQTADRRDTRADGLGYVGRVGVIDVHLISMFLRCVVPLRRTSRVASGHTPDRVKY